MVESAVESPGEGRVLVFDGGSSLRTALLGGKLVKAAAGNGWAGIVVDGCVRVLAELALFELRIRTLATVPMPPDKPNQGRRDVALRIQGIGARTRNCL